MDSMTHPTDTAKSEELKPCENPHLDADPRDEAVRTIFAETAIMMTHPDDERRALAKERVYSLLFARPASSPPQNDAGVEGAEIKLGAKIAKLLSDDPGVHGDVSWETIKAILALRTPMSELQALGQEFEAGWRPYIGQEVRAASHIVEKWPDWQDTRLWVVGIAKDRLGNQYPVEGINITVSDEWPVTGKTGGFTDGFYIGRRFEADDLIPSAPSGEG